jgi:hypothetical protein
VLSEAGGVTSGECGDGYLLTTVPCCQVETEQQLRRQPPSFIEHDLRKKYKLSLNLALSVSIKPLEIVK